MPSPIKDSFPPHVARRLGCYVYRLIDPRNGETFYVGKGKGNRVYAHIRAEAGLDGDELDNRLERIRAIRLAGFEVAHVIHRHGMDARTAFEVEAAVMDAYPGLTNAAGGIGSGERGAMHAREILRQYAAEPATFRHRALLINVSRTATELPLYEAVRCAWRLDPRRAMQAEVILATRQGLIVGAFVAREWLPATAEHFPGRVPPGGAPGRHGFVGAEAPAAVRDHYVGKRVPDRFRRPGMANPIQYTWK